MIIKGEDIILRAIEEQDCSMLKDLINDANTEEMLGGISFPISSESQMKWFHSLCNEKNTLRLIIAKSDNPDVGIGTVILSDIDYINGNSQIHIKLSDGQSRRHGYGTEAIRKTTEYAFNTLRLHSVWAEIVEYNEPSKRTFEKCGYKFNGALKSRIFKKGKYWDLYVYSIQNESN